MALQFSQWIEKVQLWDVRRTGTTLTWEAQKSPLLTSVTRKGLLKTLQAGEYLVFAAVVCKLCRSATAL
jgi:hypothetical protein